MTGGLGFIGSHLADRLLQMGHEVVVIDDESTGRRSNLPASHPALTVISHDLARPLPSHPALNGADYLFHLAALADIVPSIEQPLRYFHANVTGTVNVLDAAVKWKPKKIVYAASSSCYGIPSQYPTPETAAISPQYPYALTKNLGEQALFHWGQVYKLPVVALRFFNVYGPRSRTSGAYGAVFGVFLAQKLAGKPFTVVGDGTQTRDFTYVSDVVDAVVTAAQSDVSGDVFNVGSGKTVSVNRLTELLGGPRVYIPKRPGEPDCTFADIRKISSRLGWTPKVSIEDGVDRMMERISDWKDAPVWTPDSINVATKKWFEYLSPAAKAS